MQRASTGAERECGEQRPLAWGACGCGRSASSASSAWGRAALAELVGTALLVLLTCMPALCSDADAPPAPLSAALGSGLVVLLLVQTFDHVSGAFFNPTVTLAAVMCGRVPPAAGALLAAAQCLGAVVGAGALRALVAQKGAASAAGGLCVTAPAPWLGGARALAVEAVLGGALVLANCGAWDARNRRLLDSWPLKIGLLVAGLSYAGGALTGASMNPARSLGPALWAHRWTAHWVYWAGPLGGGAAAALLYRRLWAAPAGYAPRAAPSPVSTRRTTALVPRAPDLASQSQASDDKDPRSLV